MIKLNVIAIPNIDIEEVLFRSCQILSWIFSQSVNL